MKQRSALGVGNLIVELEILKSIDDVNSSIPSVKEIPVEFGLAFVLICAVQAPLPQQPG